MAEIRLPAIPTAATADKFSLEPENSSYPIFPTTAISVRDKTGSTIPPKSAGNASFQIDLYEGVFAEIFCEDYLGEKDRPIKNIVGRLDKSNAFSRHLATVMV